MLGDVLTSTIIAQQLKITFLESEVHYLIASGAEAVVKNHPSIDLLVKVTKEEFSSLPAVFSLSRKLKHYKYDLVIDAYGKNNSAFLSFLTRAPKRIGYKKWFSRWAYTLALDNKPDPKIYKSGISLGSRMLLTEPLTETPDWYLKPEIFLSSDEKEEGRQWLREQGIDTSKKIVMISVLGSAPNKTLPARYMALVLDHIASSSNAQILFNYIPSQRSMVDEIYEQCLKSTQKQIHLEVYAPSLRDFLKVLYHCDAIIGNEGGAINMGKALHIPSFTIFSPWVRKAVWNHREDGFNHISVHLQDYRPELYKDSKPVKFRSQALEFYESFKPELFEEKLEIFVKNHLVNP